MSEPTVIAIIAAIAAVVALKLTISFNLNQFLADRLERKNERLTARIRGACPHVEPFFDHEKGYGLRHTFDGAPSHTPWICKVCGHKVVTARSVDDNTRLWGEGGADMERFYQVRDQLEEVQVLLRQRYGERWLLFATQRRFARWRRARRLASH